jgi:hypothetical protein
MAMARETDPPQKPPSAQDQAARKDRRRPGRRAYVSPGLVPLLRSPHRADPVAEEPAEPPKE